MNTLLVSLLLIFALLISPIKSNEHCKIFQNTDFEGSDFLEQDENSPADCCSACVKNQYCGYWTFIPPTTCNLKTSDKGKRPSPASGANSYTSGCRDATCSPVPKPPAPKPGPGGQVCNIGTVCSAHYAVNGEGCCPYENATCCPNNQTCCTSGTTCVDSGLYGTICEGAIKNSTGLSVCKSGAALPLSKTLPNILIIGDSVSIGYTPYVAKNMSKIAFVQHSPYDTCDGGAEETAYGLQCLDYMLRSPSGIFLKPDVIMFNWGLHDGPLGNSTVPGQAGLPDVYAPQLEEITKKLMVAEPQAKLLFALTSPSMCDATGDGCVVNLNNQASAIMLKYNIPTINLHDAVVSQCGEPPQKKCFNQTGCFCPHCGASPSPGYTFLAEKVIVPALTSLLP
jgi:hypothetical protein